MIQQKVFNFKIATARGSILQAQRFGNGVQEEEMLVSDMEAMGFTRQTRTKESTNYIEIYTLMNQTNIDS